MSDAWLFACLIFSFFSPGWCWCVLIRWKDLDPSRSEAHRPFSSFACVSARTRASLAPGLLAPMSLWLIERWRIKSLAPEPSAKLRLRYHITPILVTLILVRKKCLPSGPVDKWETGSSRPYSQSRLDRMTFLGLPGLHDYEHFSSSREHGSPVAN